MALLVTPRVKDLATSTWRRTAGLLVVLVVAACGSSTTVGDGLDVKESDGQASCRLGECTTTTAAVAGITTTTAKPTTTTRPAAVAPSTTTTTARQAVFVIRIQADSAGRQFDPAVAKVASGSTVRWTNTDSVVRSIEAANGAFASPPIPPGESFDYKAPGIGRYEYHDGTRPYAIGYLDVV